MRKLEPIVVFLDIETTGLNPNKDRVLEVAARAFRSDTFVEVNAPFSAVVPLETQEIKDLALDPVVLKMHTDSGLLGACLLEGCKPGLNGACFQLGRWLSQARYSATNDFAGWNGRMTLAGSSVHFDASFLKDTVAVYFSHRYLDLSAAKLFCGSLRIDLPAEDDSPSTHRALADVNRDVAWYLMARERFVGGYIGSTILHELPRGLRRAETEAECDARLGG